MYDTRRGYNYTWHKCIIHSFSVRYTQQMYRTLNECIIHRTNVYIEQMYDTRNECIIHSTSVFIYFIHGYRVIRFLPPFC